MTSGQAPTTSGKVVLIVEDEAPLAQALAYIVEDAGHTPVVAGNGKVALQLAARQRPDLIITDLMMPQVDGKEMIAALRAHWDSATPPIVLMSAAGRRYTDQSGADALLTKPFAITDVEALLHQFLDNGHDGAAARG